MVGIHTERIITTNYMEKQLDLFGEEVIQSPVKRIGKNEKFEDYESFVQKHEDSTKKTTDDCYTPPPFMRW